MIAGAADLVANQREVRHLGKETGGHLGNSSVALPRLSAVDYNASVHCVELRHAGRRAGVPGRCIGRRDFIDRVVINDNLHLDRPGIAPPPYTKITTISNLRQKS